MDEIYEIIDLNFINNIQDIYNKMPEYDIYNNEPNYNVKKITPYFVQGQSYEKDEKTIYSSVKYIATDSTGNYISEYTSTDGSFKLENLVEGNINLI